MAKKEIKKEELKEQEVEKKEPTCEEKYQLLKYLSFFSSLSSLTD